MKTIVVDPDMPQKVVPLLDQWFGHEMLDKVLRVPRDRRLEGGLLMGCPIWGELYVRTFLDYTLPTMLAPRNLEALAGRSRIVLFAPNIEARMLWQRLRDVENRFGIEFQIGLLPPHVMGLIENGHPHLRYPLLGVVQTLLLHIAGRHGMGFHMLQPDHVYGPAYFENLDRLSQLYKAITHTSISASLDTIEPELNRYRNDLGGGISSLVVPDRELGDMGWRHLHPRSRLSVMNDMRFPDRLPWSHLWNWQARDHLRIYCWHTNGTYLAPDLCQKVPALNLSTLDTQLPFYMNNNDVAFPAVGDEMCFIELSEVASKPVESQTVDFETFGHRVWSMVSYTDSHLGFMKMFSEVPIMPQETWLEVSEIEARHTELLGALLDNRKDLEETDEDFTALKRNIEEQIKPHVVPDTDLDISPIATAPHGMSFGD